MKNLLLTVLLLLFPVVHAEIRTKNFTCNSKTFSIDDIFVEENCRMEGSGQLFNAHVGKQTEIFGRTLIFDSEFNDIAIDISKWDGNWVISQKIADPVTNEINSVATDIEVALVNTTIHGALVTNAALILIADSTIANIYIAANDQQQQRIVLDGKTSIQGDIIFDNEQGEVVCGPEVIFKGKVVGGTLRSK